MTSRGWFRAWEAILASFSVAVLLAMSAAAGCADTRQARQAAPQEAGSRSPGGSDESRGIQVERDRLGFEHALQVRRSKDGVPHELHDGDTVVTGDRIRLSIRTSEAAYLYLAFCAHHELAVYPPQSGIRTQAGELMVIPPVGAELVLDCDPGPEVLYVILSRAELSLADPHLAAALAAERPSNTPVDCATNLEAELARTPSDASAIKPPTPSSPNVLRGATVRKKRIPSANAPKGHRSPRSTKTTAPGPGSGSSGPNPDPAPTNPRPPDKGPPGFARVVPGWDGSDVPDYERDLERNPGAIVWYHVEGATGPVDVVASDEDGIAVVRHAFNHVAQASPPGAAASPRSGTR